jgi:hypothetical protein
MNRSEYEWHPHGIWSIVKVTIRRRKPSRPPFVQHEDCAPRELFRFYLRRENQ